MSELKRRSLYVFAFVLLVSTAFVLAQSQQQLTVESLHAGFLYPPDEARIMMRWWWFGAAVTKPELERELGVMKSAGIGGVEIQPVYPLELDDAQKGLRNLPYGSNDFLEAVRDASEKAAEMGLRVDITLGSGWPYGGPDTPVTEAAAKLRIEESAIPEGAGSAALPPMENGEKLVGVFRVSGDSRTPMSDAMQLTDIHDGRVQLSGKWVGAQTVIFFIASRTGQQVKRPALGAEGFVLDHYSKAAIVHHLTAVGDPLLRAFGTHPPHAVFSDSLEVFGTDWTSDFLDEFRQRRGYDLTPHLAAIAGNSGDEAPAIRHDWGQTLSELTDERYLTPIREWAHAHHTLFRSQTYGEPPVTLSSNALVDLPEGEHGPEWRTFSAARWASSASHLYGRAITSTETWTWLHSPAFRATPLDMKAEADLHFIQGINQLIGHGWPYSPPSADEPGWRFYASAALNEHNPWFQVMPEITRYLQRVSYLLRQGSPANDVAIYLPTDDAWARFKPGVASIDQAMEGLLGPAVIPQVLNAGFNFDFIDDRAMAAKGIDYRVLILPGVERMPLATIQTLKAFLRQGGHVIATRRLPSRAPGWLNANAESAQIATLAKELFSDERAGPSPGTFLHDEQLLGSTLAQTITPDLASASPALGFVHRKCPFGEIYFVANTSNQAINTQSQFRVSGLNAEWWDPFTGRRERASATTHGNMTSVPLSLAPYESRVLVFSGKPNLAVDGVPVSETATIDLSSQWTVTFEGLQRAFQMERLHSWTDDEPTRYYSGRAVYERTVEVPIAALVSRRSVTLEFDRPELVARSTTNEPGMRALLESPVRECALISVNGRSAGSVWHPPYALDVTSLVHAGSNTLRFEVANLAINEMAGRALPDYRLLDLRFGERFVPQGFADLKPVPAGILGKVELVIRR